MPGKTLLTGWNPEDEILYEHFVAEDGTDDFGNEDEPAGTEKIKRHPDEERENPRRRIRRNRKARYKRILHHSNRRILT